MPPKLYTTSLRGWSKSTNARRSLIHTNVRSTDAINSTQQSLCELWSYLRYVTSRVLQTLTVTGRQAPWRSTVPELEQTFVFV